MTRPIESYPVPPDEWKFKEDAIFESDDFWYDITEGGYINPTQMLADKHQLKLLVRCLDVLYSFYSAYNEKMESQEDEEDEDD